MIRLLICDDSAEARSLLRTLLADHPEIEIVGEAGDGGEAIAVAAELAPDVILMDVLMPVLDGVDATRRIHELYPGIRIVAFTGTDDTQMIRRMTDAGASAYCVKGAPLWELERAIAGASQPLFRLAHALTRSLAAGGVGQLVARELAELSGAVFAATYVVAGDGDLTLSGMAGPVAPSSPEAIPASAPTVVARAVESSEPAEADGAELAELYRILDAPAGQALSVPFLAAGSVGQLVARELAELSGAVFAATYVVAGDGDLTLSGMAGPVAPSSPEAIPASAPTVVARAVESSEPVDADGAELAELYRILDTPAGQALSVPFLAAGNVLGALLVVMPANVQHQVDTELTAAVADLAAAALANERRLALTYAEARRDALTGLPNRRAFDEYLDRLLEEAEATGGQVALAVLDLDSFKRINDEQGHAAGDRVLREVGRVLLRELRASEELFRIGGEEFAIALTGDAAAGAQVSERLRRQLTLQQRGEQLPTVSVGVAAYPSHSGTKAELYERADAALYAAKSAGKNRVVVSGEEEELAALRPPSADEAVAVGFGRVEQAPRRSSDEPHRGLRILVVDDDADLRMLLRTTLEIVDVEIDEAATAGTANERIAARRPDVIVLDIGLPDVDGLSFCSRLKRNVSTRSIPVVLLTGADAGMESAGRAAGADAFLRKPFSPVELLSTVERVAGRLYEGPFRLMTDERPEEQLLLYAQDLRRLLEIERTQRVLIQKAYEETVSALVTALESKDFGTSAHSQRVRRYATELTAGLDAELLDDASLEYGFLLHDVGKIGIPDLILRKPGPLTKRERGLMETHTIIGEQMLQSVSLLQGEGLKVIRHHHERWDGQGYPDGLSGEEIPRGGRIFAVADALDAMTSARPYRDALSWDAAVRELLAEAGRQFDPEVIESFRSREPKLRRIYWELSAA